jgi:hypothetical protein
LRFRRRGLTLVQDGKPDVLVPFADVSGANWMSKNLEEKVRMKATPDFDRLLIEQFNGRTVVIDGLGQAVFPLLRAFELIGQQNAKNRSDSR